MVQDRADDLLQNFILEKILERNLLKAVDPIEGKFRTFLLTALDRFVIDSWRKESRKVPTCELVKPPAVVTGRDVFDAWGIEVLVEAVCRMQAECKQKQCADLWGVFENRTLAPLCGVGQYRTQLLAECFGLDDAKQAANRQAIALRCFGNFSQTIAEYADGDVDSETQDFLVVFGQACADCLRNFVSNCGMPFQR